MVTIALGASFVLSGCGLTGEEGALGGLTGDCVSAIHELERERGVPVDVTFAGVAGGSVRFTDTGRPPLRAGVVLQPPEDAHITDPSGRWTGPVDYAHSRLSTLLLADALPATRGNVERLEVTWQRPGETFTAMQAVVDVSGVTGRARVEGTDVVADVRVPATWGPAAIGAGAEGIDVAVADAGTATPPGATTAVTTAGEPGTAGVRIPVTAFTGAPPAPGTQVEIPLVARFSYATTSLLQLRPATDSEALPDYGTACDRPRREGPPATHDFSRYEQLDVYVVARLVVAA